jgi:methylenetetrahydrofolate dehydrogenase (NADP+)/methenyltetrahydrofolate cyclohydrolase
MVTKDFIKPGATVIDVGINQVTDAAVADALFPEGHPRRNVFRAKGTILVGDVHPNAAEVAGALTPVPNGVGPLTIAMLMANTLTAARARIASGGRA